MEAVAKRGRKPFVEEHFGQFVSKNQKRLMGISTASDAFNLYLSWADQHSDRSISQASFNKMFKSMPVARAAPEKKTFRLSLVEQFDMMEQYVKILAAQNINSLFIAGLPGIGKTETVQTTLAALGVKYEYYQGGIKDAYSLAKILYEHRDHEVLVFDDFDSLYRNKNCIDILKVALQDHSVRTITWADSTKRAVRDVIPHKFQFTSSCIFISNKTRIDPAIRNRSMMVHIEGSKIECLEWVKRHFDTFISGIPMEYKNIVYEFAKDNIGRFKSMDYRVFKKAVCDFLVCRNRGLDDNYWKKVVLQNADF